MGYQWRHYVKLEPTDGVDEVIVLRQELLEGHGPVRTTVVNRDEQETREDINRTQHQEVFGFRQRVTIRAEVFDMKEHRSLVKIANAFRDPDTKVHLSLDGGLTYKEVIMRRVPSPRAIRNMTIVGASFDLGMETAVLEDELVAIADGW